MGSDPSSRGPAGGFLTEVILKEMRQDLLDDTVHLVVQGSARGYVVAILDGPRGDHDGVWGEGDVALRHYLPVPAGEHNALAGRSPRHVQLS